MNWEQQWLLMEQRAVLDLFDMLSDADKTQAATWHRGCLSNSNDQRPSSSCNRNV